MIRKGKLLIKVHLQNMDRSCGGTGIVFGQSFNTNIRKISYDFSIETSEYISVTDCVSVLVKDLGEKGIDVTVQNISSIDIEDFRIRVLWFNNGELEPVAYRWLEDADHRFYAGEKKTVDFKRKWGHEEYLVIL